MRLDGTMESGESFNDVGDVNVVDGDGVLGAIDGVVDVGVGNIDVLMVSSIMLSMMLVEVYKC